MTVEHDLVVVVVLDLVEAGERHHQAGAALTRKALGLAHARGTVGIGTFNTAQVLKGMASSCDRSAEILRIPLLFSGDDAQVRMLWSLSPAPRLARLVGIVKSSENSPYLDVSTLSL